MQKFEVDEYNNHDKDHIRQTGNNECPVIVSGLEVTGIIHPYTAIALSPNSQRAFLASKDTLRLVSICPFNGLKEIRSFSVSQYFQSTQSTTTAVVTRGDQISDKRKSYAHVRDAFGLVHVPSSDQRAAQQQQVGPNDVVNITDVAWSGSQNHHVKYPSNISIPQSTNNNDYHYSMEQASGINSTIEDHQYNQKASKLDDEDEDDSLLAAAGSNGVVVVWRVSNLFHGKVAAPEAVLAGHSRAVNKLAWHPSFTNNNDMDQNKICQKNVLLTASQDSTIKIWDRIVSSSSVPSNENRKNQKSASSSGGIRSWWGAKSSTEDSNNPKINNHKLFTWHCAFTFQPKSEPVRDIQWDPFHSNVFALVTDGGYLIAYDIRLFARPLVRIAAHSGDATTIDWHPTQPYIIATGGGRDCIVKIWNLEDDLSIEKKEERKKLQQQQKQHLRNDEAHNMKINSDSIKSEGNYSGINDGAFSSSTNFESFNNPNAPISKTTLDRNYSTIGAYSASAAIPPPLTRSVSFLQGSSRSSKSSTAIYTLSVSSPTVKLKWRPPSFYASISKQDNHEDRHVAMLAIATAPAGGANARGQGHVGLWSYHRPFMPLSVVEGHLEGAVTDFIWLDTPQITIDGQHRNHHKDGSMMATFDMSLSQDILGSSNHSTAMKTVKRKGRNTSSVKSIESKSDEGEMDLTITAGTWQHIMSVGKDGRCLLQSLARGTRPISQVPPSTFAIANLSPFQRGFGSLQIMAVHQKVPNGDNNDFALTGLRRDIGTAMVPGIFKEEPPSKIKNNKFHWQPKLGGQREPSKVPDIEFFAMDSGDLDEATNLPVTCLPSGDTVICPEVVHISRFAESYRMRTDGDFPTKVSLCIHNSEVAEKLNFHAHARMWQFLASILESSDTFDLSNINEEKVLPSNPMFFLIQPTLKSLLLERADAGDVQTCVVLCEIMEVIPSHQHTISSQMSSVTKTALPGLDINIVREWYLSYIDLLQQMCLFSHAAYLIKICNDPTIGAMNQKSTRFHESCPSCGKLLQGVTVSKEVDQKGNEATVITTQRACESCRKRIGFCFLCHEPVKGVFVWCPGCGHGGHLDHALEWFGSNEFCPTGCGHKCNLLQQSCAFPRTDSLLKCLPVSD